jgi:hypothetical protein
VSKNVAVFVDVANIFYAAKAAGVDIDYVTLLKSATAGRDFVRAYAYTGLDPDNENQRNFHQFLARHQYKVVSKDIRKYGDGKVKANLDIELVVDMMKTARNLDIAIVVSGDGDFAPAACDDSFGTRAPATGGTDLGAGEEPVSFEEMLSGLEPRLTYYYCAAASNLGGAAFGEVLTFTTEAIPSTQRHRIGSVSGGDGRKP